MKSDTQSLFGLSAANCLFTLSSGHGVALSLIVVFIRFPRKQAHGSHEPCDSAPSNRNAFARQLPPDLAYPIDAEVLRENPSDMDRQLGVPLRPFRQAIRIGFPAGVFVPGGWGDVQNPAHRLDPKLVHMGFHEANHFFNGRSRSAAAK